MKNKINDLNWEAVKPLKSNGFWYCGPTESPTDIVIYKDNEQHAKLIAAAPELLKAVMEYKRIIQDEGCIPDFEQIELSKLMDKAFKKATK